MTQISGRCPLLVLGATGMLGQALMAESQRQGLAVIGLSRSGSEVACDVCDDGALLAALSRLSPAMIVNAVALADVEACEMDRDRAWRLNARLPALLADWSVRNGSYLIHISTDHFFSGDANRLHSEDDPLRLVNEYARSKYAGECMALSCPGALALRTNIVGFRGWPERPTFVESMLARLGRREAVSLYSNYYTSSIAVAQFAEVMLDFVPLRPAGRMNLASCEVSSKLDFVLALANRCGLDSGACIVGSVGDHAGTPRAESLGLNVSRVESLLGRTMPTRKEVIDCLSREFGERNLCKSHSPTTIS